MVEEVQVLVQHTFVQADTLVACHLEHQQHQVHDGAEVVHQLLEVRLVL